MTILPFEERQKLWSEARSPQMRQKFLLPNVPPSVRLDFEPLSYENGIKLWSIFKDDTNPFVDERFQTVEETADYVACMLEYAQFSRKRAAFDWLLKSKETGEYIGVFHLHDLSNEVFGGANQKATMGYAIGEKHRSQGFAKEAITHATKFLFENTNKIRLLIYSKKTNTNSIRLMESLNWQRNDAQYVYSEEYAYFEMVKNNN
jgi:RimJ/RimL family protein N-acetyltransferase